MVTVNLPETPEGWQLLERGEDGAKYVRIFTDQTVILSWSDHEDGHEWLHFSTAFPNKIPSWSELVKAKELFCGTESKAIQVIPPRSKYVNLNPYVLHLFVCVNGDPLPEFSGIVNGVRTL